MPDPILVSNATAFAAKSATLLDDLVNHRFTRRGEAETALKAAEGAPPDSPEVTALATHLAFVEIEASTFGEDLRHTWQQAIASQGGVVNQITGNVSGKVVQARDIESDISF